MARREDHDRAWMAGQDALKRLQEHALFFVVDGAAADQDGGGFRGSEAFAKIGEHGGIGAWLLVELQVSGDLDAGIRRADFDKPLTIFPSLGQEQVDLRKNAGQPPVEAKIAAQGAVGDARIDDGQARATAFGQAQEIRPELGFGDDDEIRTQRLQVWIYGKTQVDRKIKDAFGAETSLGQMLARVGGGRDDDANLRPVGAHALDQAADRQDFSHGNGMHPDRGLAEMLGQARRYTAETLAEARPVLPVTQHLVYPVRNASEQNQRQQRTIDEIHEFPILTAGIVLQDVLTGFVAKVSNY